MQYFSSPPESVFVDFWICCKTVCLIWILQYISQPTRESKINSLMFTNKLRTPSAGLNPILRRMCCLRSDLRFFGYNQTAPNHQYGKRRALADVNYKGSSVPIALEDSWIIVGLRENAPEFQEKALKRVVRTFSTAVTAVEKVQTWAGEQFPSSRLSSRKNSVCSQRRLCRALRQAMPSKKNYLFWNEEAV